MAGPILRIRSAVLGADEQVLVLGDAPVHLGRSDENDIVLLEQTASRRHARIDPVDGGYEIVDLGSNAGLFLRGEQRVQRHRLVDGDEFKVGSTTIRFVASAGSEATLAPTPSPPSSQPTEAQTAAPPSKAKAKAQSDLIGEAETMLPEDMLSAPGTVAAAHVPQIPPPSGGTQPASEAPAPPSWSAPIPQAADQVDATAQTAPAPGRSVDATQQAVPPPPARSIDATQQAAPPPPARSIDATQQASPPPPARSIDATQQASPPPAAPQPMAHPPPDPSQPAVPPSSNPSFVMGGSGPSSSWSDGSVGGPSEQPGGPAPDYQLQGSAPSADYSLDGPPAAPGGSFGDVDLHGGGAPVALRSSSGAGLFVVFGVVGAGGAFALLSVLYGLPW